MIQTKKLSTKNRQLHEQKMRARIKSAAFKLMAEYGIENVSMRQIAEKVHVTKPVLYYYFKDKEDLCSAIILERARQFDEFLEKEWQQGLSVTPLLASVLERHLEFFQNDPRNSKFIVRTIAYVLNNKSKKLKDTGRMGRLSELFAQAAQKGEINPQGLTDFERLVRAVMLQIMLSAYVQLNAREALWTEDKCCYDKAAVGRLAQIITLGINEYYKRNKK